jgi:uncharacterized membrane protein
MANPLSHYAWLIYVLIAVVYTMIEFGISFTNFGTPAFSERNAKKPAAVVGIHMAFLAILLGFIWFAFYFYESRYSSLPDWLTVRVGRGGSLYSISSIILILLIGAVECRWVFVRSDTDDPDPDDGNPF